MLEKIDFNELYMKQKELSSFKIKSREAWNSKAKGMNRRVHNSIYNEEFLEVVDLENCKTLLDVGCGVGNLSLRLSSKLENIYSLDYSEKMLELLNENSLEKNIKNISTINLSWEDSWEDVPKCDIVIASRSMEVLNMKEALEKLDEKAKKRVYITTKVGGSFLSDEILEILQKDIIKKPDYIYPINILYSMGINAKIDFIRSEGRCNVYANKDEFVKSVAWSIGDLTSDEINKLENYYSKKLQNQCENNQEYVKWAVISWNKED